MPDAIASASFKWDADNTAKAVEMWDAAMTANPNANGRAVAEKIAEELIGSKDSVRRVIGKLTREGKYSAPEKEVKEKKPTLLKSEVMDAIKEQNGFEHESLKNMTVAGLVALAEHLDVDVPEATVK